MQMQVCMGITALASCDFFAYVSETDYKLVEVKYDHAHFEECVHAVRSIYVDYLFAELRGAFN